MGPQRVFVFIAVKTNSLTLKYGAEKKKKVLF